MARFQVDCPDNLLSDLEGLFDDVADEMIDAALPVYQREIQSQLESHRDTGELIDSIKVQKSRPTQNNAHIGYITAEGGSTTSSYKRKNGKKEPFRNFLKLMALEYGVAGRQPATPFMQSAKSKSEPGIQKAMQGVFDRKGQK